MLKFFGLKRNQSYRDRRANSLIVSAEEDKILEKIDEMLKSRARASTSITPELVEANNRITNSSTGSSFLSQLFGRRNPLSLESQIASAQSTASNTLLSNETRKPFRFSQSPSGDAMIPGTLRSAAAAAAVKNELNVVDDVVDDSQSLPSSPILGNATLCENEAETHLPIIETPTQPQPPAQTGIDIGEYLALPNSIPRLSNGKQPSATINRPYTPPQTPVSVVMSASDSAVVGSFETRQTGNSGNLARQLLSPSSTRRPSKHHQQQQQQQSQQPQSSIASPATMLPVEKHILQSGFLGGQHYDLQMAILGKVFRLHRLLLCRSPFFSRLLNRNQQQQQQQQQLPDSNDPQSSTLELNISDPTILSHPLAVDICLAWLYGLNIPFTAATTGPDGKSTSALPAHQIYGFAAGAEFAAMFQINSQNVLAVMICAHLFQLTDLSQQCVQFICQFELVPLTKRRRKANRFISYLSPAECSSVMPIDTPIVLRYAQFLDGADYGAAISGRIEEQLLAYLCSEGYESLAEAFTSLPMHWLDRVLEADAFYCPTEFARYEFIRDLIKRRRDLRNRSLNSQQHLSPQQQAEIQQEERAYIDLVRYAVIFTHMTFEQLNTIRQDGLIPEEILMKSLWQQTRFKSIIESVPVDESAQLLMDPANREIEHIPPIRVGLQFDQVHRLADNERSYSQTFFYGGCWWNVFLQRFQSSSNDNRLVNNESGGSKWGIFVRRSEHGKVLTRTAVKEQPTTLAPAERNNRQSVQCPLVGCEVERSVSYYDDPRRAVRAHFKLFNPHLKIHEAIFESRENDYVESQSWGYRSHEQILGGGDDDDDDDDYHQSAIVEGLPISIRYCLVFRYL